MSAPDPHLEHYRRELSYLRTESANFGARYPKLARRLVLTDAESADPHIQHLSNLEAMGSVEATGSVPTFQHGLLRSGVKWH